MCAILVQTKTNIMKHLIQSTANFNVNTGSYTPCKGTTVHGRINHRAGRFNYQHISHCVGSYFTQDMSHVPRLQRYEDRCLERGIKPFHMDEDAFNGYMREIQDEIWCSQQDEKFLHSVGHYG